MWHEICVRACLHGGGGAQVGEVKYGGLPHLSGLPHLPGVPTSMQTRLKCSQWHT